MIGSLYLSVFTGASFGTLAFASGHNLLESFIVYWTVGLFVFGSTILVSTIVFSPKEEYEEGSGQEKPTIDEYRADYEYWFKKMNN